MFTLAAFSKSVALTTTQDTLTGVPDQHIKVQGNDLVIPELNKFLGAMGVGLDIQNVQLASPSLRRLALHDIAPVEPTATPSFPPDPILKGESLLALDIDESLNALAGNANAGAQQESVIVFLSDDDVAPVKGKIFTVKATATAPATGYVWSPAVLTFAQTLPTGIYNVVGARCEYATGIAFRLIFIGGKWRPGHICVADKAAKNPLYSRYGELGIWGAFPHNQQPSIELFGTAAGGAVSLFFDLIKTI